MVGTEGNSKVLDIRDNAGTSKPCDIEGEMSMKIKLKVEKRYLPFTVHRSLFTVVLLFTVYCLLSTVCFADDISSKAVVVMEASTGRVLFAKNPTLRLPPASTTKLVTAMIVLDKARLSDMITISERATKVPSLRETKFKEGEAATVETLLYAALIRSANDAAFALAEHVAGSEEKFVELMNRKVRIIGARDTRFINATGLPGKGQRITVYDLAKIMRYALRYPMIKEIISKREAEISTEEGRVIPLENTNKLLWSDNGAVGGKTGYTRAARHCFVHAGERDDETVIVALLGAPSRKILWDEAKRLEARGFDVLANNEQPVVYFAKADYQKSSKIKTYSKGNKKKIGKVSSKKKSKTLQAKKKKADGSKKANKKGKGSIVAMESLNADIAQKFI
jgi:D-alanyl-D-alanine carboxypeptidase (penicillin-binding protein 5/6)